MVGGWKFKEACCTESGTGTESDKGLVGGGAMSGMTRPERLKKWVASQHISERKTEEEEEMWKER